MKKPDLRYAGKLDKGVQGVLLEVTLDLEQVLISDFMAWHCVLNDGYLAFTEEENESFYSGVLETTKKESWASGGINIIFTLRFYRISVRRSEFKK